MLRHFGHPGDGLGGPRRPTLGEQIPCTASGPCPGASRVLLGWGVLRLSAPGAYQLPPFERGSKRIVVYDVATGAELREQAVADLVAAEELLAGVEGGDSLSGLVARLLDEARRLEPGCVAPEIEGKDLDGVAFKLSDYRGKVVLLDFWGDW